MVIIDYLWFWHVYLKGLMIIEDMYSLTYYIGFLWIFIHIVEIIDLCFLFALKKFQSPLQL